MPKLEKELSNERNVDNFSSQSHSTTRSVRKHGNNINNNASTNNDDDAEESMVSSTQFKGDTWTKE